MSRATVDAVNVLPEHHRVLRLVVPALGFPSAEVGYQRAGPGGRHAPSTRSSRMVRLSVDSLTGFSTAPLRLATWFGLLGGLAALVLLGYALGRLPHRSHHARLDVDVPGRRGRRRGAAALPGHAGRVRRPDVHPDAGPPLVLRRLRLAGAPARAGSGTAGRDQQRDARQRAHRQVALGGDHRAQPVVDQRRQLLQVAAAAGARGAAPPPGAAARSRTAAARSRSRRAPAARSASAGCSAGRAPPPRRAPTTAAGRTARRPRSDRPAAAPAAPRGRRRRRPRCARARRRRPRGRGWHRRPAAPSRRPQGGQPALGGDACALGAVLQRGGPPAQVAQHPGVAATGGADVQRRARAEPAQLTGQQVPALAVPPVRVLELGQLAHLGCFHRRASCQARWWACSAAGHQR